MGRYISMKKASLCALAWGALLNVGIAMVGAESSNSLPKAMEAAMLVNEPTLGQSEVLLMGKNLFLMDGNKAKSKAAQPSSNISKTVNQRQVTSKAVDLAKAGLTDEELRMFMSNKPASYYKGQFWRLDMANVDELPRNFRMSQSSFKEALVKGESISSLPSREGLDDLHISGSGEPSADGMKDLVAAIRKKAGNRPIYIVDLRQESHGYANGTAISWYGKRDWGNIEKTQEQAIVDEEELLQGIEGKEISIYKINKKKEPIDPQIMQVNTVQTEKEMAKVNGIHYVRIAVTDHLPPTREEIQRFVTFVNHLPKDAWVHFHCEAGKGRTTTFMAMYDMMRNPKVPFETILQRQYLLGGEHLDVKGQVSSTNSWDTNAKIERRQVLWNFYQRLHGMK